MTDEKVALGIPCALCPGEIAPGARWVLIPEFRAAHPQCAAAAEKERKAAAAEKARARREKQERRR